MASISCAGAQEQWGRVAACAVGVCSGLLVAPGSGRPRGCVANRHPVTASFHASVTWESLCSRQRRIPLCTCWKVLFSHLEPAPSLPLSKV